MVGAFRSNEVDDSHTLSSTIKILEDQDTSITQLGCTTFLLFINVHIYLV